MAKDLLPVTGEAMGMAGLADARRVAWVLAVALLGSGLVAMGFVIFPMQFGVTEWEVTVVLQAGMTASLGSIGWGLVLWLSLTGERSRWVAPVGAVLGVLVGVVALLGAMLVALDAPVVWPQVPAPGSSPAGFPVKAAIVKAISLAVVIAFFFLGSSITVLRSRVLSKD